MAARSWRALQMGHSAVLSTGMGAFDSLALVVGFFNPESPLVTLNQKLHSSTVYNVFQIGVSALAVFSGGAYLGMKERMKLPPTCFVAGTMILTATGLIAIENIKAGDRVISTDPDTFETAEKTVLETYIREVPQLVHLTINQELIITTMDHPFYVKEQGFINAGELKIGESCIWVHNASYIDANRVPKDSETVLRTKPEEYTPTDYKAPRGGNKVYRGKDGNYYYRDTLHRGKGAHLEVFNKAGNHLGEADPLTGVIKPGTADPTKHYKPR